MLLMPDRENPTLLAFKQDGFLFRANEDFPQRHVWHSGSLCYVDCLLDGPTAIVAPVRGRKGFRPLTLRLLTSLSHRQLEFHSRRSYG